jgi:hypothetical protein
LRHEFSDVAFEKFRFSLALLMLEAVDAFLSNQDNWVTIGYIGGGSFVLLVLLGITNTIVVYRDVSDFLWSVALIVVPFATLVTQSLLMPENVPIDYNVFWETTQTKIVSVIGGLITTHAILKTFINCISNNGIIIGPVMFIFKICASIVSIFVCMAVFNKLFENQRTIRSVLIGIIIFGVFTFFLKRLINGDSVARKKLNA